MKSIWNGYLTLGALNVPVKLYSAAHPQVTHFIQLHEKDGSPVRRSYKCEAEGVEIEHKDIVRAIEHEPGNYVVLTDQELERIDAGATKRLDVRQFTDLHQIDPVYFDKPYYVVPSKGGEHAYVLLRDALVKASKVAIVQYVFYNKDHLGALRPRDGILMLHQLRFADEIVPRSDVKTPPFPSTIPAELSAALNVLEHLSSPFYAEDYHDEHRERIQALAERKAKGLPPPKAERPAPLTTPEGKILLTLQASIKPPDNEPPQLGTS